MTFADHLLKRHRFDRMVMLLYVRWYVSYKLSDRDLAVLLPALLPMLPVAAIQMPIKAPLLKLLRVLL